LRVVVAWSLGALTGTSRSFPHSVHNTIQFPTRRDSRERDALCSSSHNPINMLPIEEAIVHLNSQDVPHISGTARRFGVNRSTLFKKFRRQSGSKSQAAQQKQFLSTRQERTLIKHINRLCERSFPSTTCMVASFAGRIAQRQPGKNWASRFVKRWSTELDSKDLNTLDVSRHKAESVGAFKQYFGILSSMAYSLKICTI